MFENRKSMCTNDHYWPFYYTVVTYFFSLPPLTSPSHPSTQRKENGSGEGARWLALPMLACLDITKSPNWIFFCRAHPLQSGANKYKEMLKVVGSEKWGGSGVWLLLEYGTGPWRSMSVYIFMKPSPGTHSRFFKVFPFPVCNAQLLGDWYENRWGAPNTIFFLIIRQYIGAPMYPAPTVMADRTWKKIRET